MSNWKRLIAGVLATVVLVGAFALTGGMKGGQRTDGLLYQASGLRPDGELLLVNGETVTCEEFLYWLDYDCQYLAAYIPELDWNAALTEDMTYGDYALEDVLQTVKLYSVVRQWAEESGTVLTEEVQAQLAQERADMVSYYGSEEAYQYQLTYQGITDEFRQYISETVYLYRLLYQRFCTPGDALYPSDAELTEYAAGQNLMTALVVTIPAGDEAEETAADAAKRLAEAADLEAEYAAICTELEQEATGAISVAAVAGDGLSDTIAALEVGEVSQPVSPYGDGAYYVAVRQELDLPAVAELYFDTALTARRESAKVTLNDDLYGKLNVADFCEKLTALRAEMQVTDGENDGAA